MAEEEKSQEFLEAVRTATELREMYQKDPKQKSFNLLLLGEMGTGKSFIIRTARKPVHIDSFDPGGTKGLRDEIAAGDIIVDSRWESENPMEPEYFLLWTQIMEERKQNGYFNHLGTYVIDSSTNWAKMIMNDILKKAGIPGQAPRFTKDYGPQKQHIENFIRLCLDLPCDFIITGHLEPYQDEQAGMTRFRFMTTGKGAIILPTLFDEVWVTQTKETSKGNEYLILTQNTEIYTARSRLAKNGLLEQYEKPDIKAILKKAGMDHEDKPKLF